MHNRYGCFNRGVPPKPFSEKCAYSKEAHSLMNGDPKCHGCSWDTGNAPEDAEPSGLLDVEGLIDNIEVTDSENYKAATVHVAGGSPGIGIGPLLAVDSGLRAMQVKTVPINDCLDNTVVLNPYTVEVDNVCYFCGKLINKGEEIVLSTGVDAEATKLYAHLDCASKQLHYTDEDDKDDGYCL